MSLTIPVGLVQRVADALQTRPAPNVPIANALPVHDILLLARLLHIGPIHKLLHYQMDAPLPTNDEPLGRSVRDQIYGVDRGDGHQSDV